MQTYIKKFISTIWKNMKECGEFCCEIEPERSYLEIPQYYVNRNSVPIEEHPDEEESMCISASTDLPLEVKESKPESEDHDDDHMRSLPAVLDLSQEQQKCNSEPEYEDGNENQTTKPEGEGGPHSEKLEALPMSKELKKEEQIPPKKTGYCRECREKFVDIERIANNLSREEWIKPYKECKKGCHWCYFCKSILQPECDITDHIIKHLENSEVKCEHCLRKEKTPGRLQQICNCSSDVSKKIPVKFKKNIISNDSVPRSYTRVYCKRCKHFSTACNHWEYPLRPGRHNVLKCNCFWKESARPQSYPHSHSIGNYIRNNGIHFPRGIITELPFQCKVCKHFQCMVDVQQNISCKECFKYHRM